MSLTNAAARIRTLTVALAVAVAACEAPVPTTSQRPSQLPTPSAERVNGPRPGGTIFVLMESESWGDVDPQRVSTREDLAFFGATTSRSLVSYAYSPDAILGTQLIPDLATDLGSATDDGRTWSFTLRDGLTWEDGSALVCADVAYGVSRTFATDITGGGPSHAIRYLDIPTNEAGESSYPGPYTATPDTQALFDAAVACDASTITFHLNQPVGDFNDATTLGMSPVPNPTDHPDLEDPGGGYGVTSQLWSNGPYRVDSYERGPGNSMVLVRNEHWNRDSDPIRPAYPDRWVVEFGIDPLLLDQRLMNPSGDDEFALQYGQIQPQNLPRVFADADKPRPAFEGRAVSAYDGYSRYYWVNIEKIQNEKIRVAIGVALDREAAQRVLGGAFYGDYADGIIKPNIGPDYADTRYYEDLFGFPIPPQGDPEAAARLIGESGEDAPTLEWSYADTPVGQQYFEVVRESLGRAGFTIEPKPHGPVGCYALPCPLWIDGDFGNGGSRPAWPNASTVIPPVLIEPDELRLPKVEDPDFLAGVQNALGTLDRAARATEWQALNREAVRRGWVIPTFFTRSQVLAGTKVGPIYRWPAYASWPYGVMFVVP